MARGRLRGTVCVVLLVFWIGASPAYASDDEAPNHAPAVAATALTPLARPTLAPTERLTSWYGYQIMLADAASLGLGLATNRSEVLIAGYFLGPIPFHVVHRRPGLAAVSPAMRLLLPFIGVVIGTQRKTCNANGDECLLGGTFIGGGIGAAAAMILDWSLAWEKAVVVPPPTNGKPAGFALTGAGFSPTTNGVRLVLAGRF